MTKPSLHITTAGLFPLFQTDLPVSEQRKDLASGLGVTVFDGPQGHGFFKGGHDGQTANPGFSPMLSFQPVAGLEEGFSGYAG
jgi:hypothetical protein